MVQSQSQQKLDQLNQIDKYIVLPIVSRIQADVIVSITTKATYKIDKYIVLPIVSRIQADDIVSITTKATYKIDKYIVLSFLMVEQMA